MVRSPERERAEHGEEADAVHGGLDRRRAARVLPVPRAPNLASVGSSRNLEPGDAQDPAQPAIAEREASLIGAATGGSPAQTDQERGLQPGSTRAARAATWGSVARVTWL